MKQCGFELLIDVVMFSSLTNAIYICNLQYVRIIVFCDLPALFIIGLLNHHSSCEVKMTSNCYFNLHNFNSEKENCSILQSLVYLFLCELSGLFLCHPMLSSLRKHFYSLIINWLLCYTWDNHISFSLSFLTKVFCHADIKNLYFSNLWVIFFLAFLFCVVILRCTLLFKTTKIYPLLPRIFMVLKFVFLN